jgi:hypothetical protein
MKGDIHDIVQSSAGIWCSSMSMHTTINLFDFEFCKSLINAAWDLYIPQQSSTNPFVTITIVYLGRHDRSSTIDTELQHSQRNPTSGLQG